MITYLSASKTLDFIIDGIEEFIGVTIISNYSDEIKKALIIDLNHGLTTYNAKSGFGNNGENNDIEILYTVVTRFEINKLKNQIQSIDEKAFIIMSSVKDVHGGLISKKTLHD